MAVKIRVQIHVLQVNDIFRWSCFLYLCVIRRRVWTFKKSRGICTVAKSVSPISFMSKPDGELTCYIFFRQGLKNTDYSGLHFQNFFQIPRRKPHHTDSFFSCWIRTFKQFFPCTSRSPDFLILNIFNAQHASNSSEGI